MSDALWSVVLAAGTGRRLASVTGGVPKQFWAPRDGRTLLEQTIDRMRALVPTSRLVTVVDASQHQYAAAIDARTPLGRVVLQTGDRGTATGILRGLIEIGSGPEDLVILTPSDHGIARPRLYHRGLREATWEVQSGRSGIVLLAVEPTAAATDLGWILPAAGRSGVSGRIGRVRKFVEKPAPVLASTLFSQGAVWNTMVVVARVSALLDLYRARAPMLAEVFDEARLLADDRRGLFLSACYPQLPSVDFSRDILAPSTHLHVYLWPDAVGWTDLGTPDRLQGWLNRRGLTVRVSEAPADAAIAAHA